MASNIVDDNSDNTYFDMDSTLQAEKLEQDYNEQEFNSSNVGQKTPDPKDTRLFLPG